MALHPQQSEQARPPRLTPPPSGRRSALIFGIAAATAVIYALWGAFHRAWVCDDAFISFRYADNLRRGLGLVFNPSERVEGYSNFLWTLWAALGLRLGADAERWSIVSGALCYGGTVALLAALAWRNHGRGGTLLLPLAAIGAAAHRDWNNYATSGLETSAYTLLLVGAYALLMARNPARARPPSESVAPPGKTVEGDRRSPVETARALALSADALHPFLAGAVLALAAMTRPEGPLVLALAGAGLLLTGRRRGAAFLAAGFLLLWLPYMLWRIRYYGDLFPNPYYAKSAGQAWYAQGWAYVRLYFEKYWVLAVGATLAAVAWRRPPRPGIDDPWKQRTLLAALVALGYTAFILRLGGDFMYARLLIPATPFFLLLTESAVVRLVPHRAAWQGISGAVLALGLLLTPYPFSGEGWIRGITNEWEVYRKPVASANTRQAGLILRPYFDGLPVRVAFLGGEARLVYYARPQVAIESQTGLTDRFLARRPLAARGRPGHEKVAPLSYLLDQRAVHFAFNPLAERVLGLSGAIPPEPVRFGPVSGRILTWDPALMDSLRRRGAQFQDFPAQLDGVLRRLPQLPDAEVSAAYAGIKSFYFEHVSDPAREQPFIERLQRSGRAPR